MTGGAGGAVEGIVLLYFRGSPDYQANMEGIHKIIIFWFTVLSSIL